MESVPSGGDEFARLERVAHSRTSIWVAAAITLAGLVIFTGVFYFLWPTFGENVDGALLIVLGLLMSVVPAALWLYLFYRQDRLEPEPKRMVLNIYLLGILVMAALYPPVTEGVLNLSEWLHDSWWSHLLGSIFVVGFIEQFMVWAIVRYVMFPSPEFDERVDGVIYAVAAGLGLATVVNFQYVLARGGVDLDIGAVRVTVNALAQAAFAGVLGYFIGQVRFEKTPMYYMPLGLTIAALINGLFSFVLDRTQYGSLNYNPWIDLILAAVMAAAMMGVVFWLIERANEETLRMARTGPPTSGGTAVEAATLPPPIAPGNGGGD